MELLEAIERRHSVRQYLARPLEADLKNRLDEMIDGCNTLSGLHIQPVYDEPTAFRSPMARYGRFEQVSNYIVLAGERAEDLDERCGYWGERIVLQAQQWGLNTCWVGMSYSKRAVPVEVAAGEKIVAVIALGYGRTQGVAHKSRPIEKIADIGGDHPEWFCRGVEAALLAPTAMNQQKFRFEYSAEGVRATTRWGFYSKVDLGIAKYHFEIGAAPHPVRWL